MFKTSAVVIAYIDPGSGSYFFQILIAAVVAGLFSLKNFWSKVIRWYQNLFKR